MGARGAVDASARRKVAIVASCGIALVLFDQSFVGVAYPFIGADVDASVGITSMLLTTYFVVAGSTMAVMGRLGDLTGLRAMIVIAFAALGIGDAVAAMSPSPGVLLLARAISGLAIAGCVTSGLALLSRAFPAGVSRQRAFSLWIAGTGAGSIVGALAGGFLGGRGAWRFGFAAAAVVACLLAAMALRLESPRRAPRPERFSLDVLGSALLVVGLIAVLVALSETNQLGWVVPPNPVTIGGLTVVPKWFPVTPVLLGLGFTSLAAMALVETRRARRKRHVLLDPALLRVPTFRSGLIVLVMVTMVSAGLLGASPLVTEYLFGFTPWDVSLVVISLAGGTLMGALAALAAARRIGAARLLMVAIATMAAVLVTSGALLAASEPVAKMYALPLALFGVTAGIALSSLNNVILADVRPNETGLGVGMSQTAANVGAGAAVIVTMLLLVSFETADIDGSISATHRQLSRTERTALIDAVHFRPFGTAGPRSKRTARARDERLWDRPQLQAERGVLLQGIRTAFIAMLGTWTLLCGIALVVVWKLQQRVRRRRA